MLNFQNYFFAGNVLLQPLFVIDHIQSIRPCQIVDSCYRRYIGNIALFRSSSYGFWNNSKFTLSRSCDLKIEKYKICYFACSNTTRVNNWLRFALSLKVSEITTNLYFWDHVTLRVMWCKLFLKKLKFLLLIGEIVENVY